MKKAYLIFSFLLSILLLLIYEDLIAWGFQGHKKITGDAIDIILRLDGHDYLKKIFSENRGRIIEKSIEPDLVRRRDESERYNHYIDIDRYGKYPFTDLPRDKEGAIRRYGYERVKRNGLLPWRIKEMVDSLEKAFLVKDVDRIVHFASWLAHYVEDAHQPLHVTENYDGQLTDQIGIHSRFERELIERIIWQLSNIDLPSEVELIDDPLEFAFSIILESYLLVDSVLSADMFARRVIPMEKLYRVEKERGRIRYIYSDEYYSILASRLSGLVIDRFRKSAWRLASLWFTAWYEANKHNLK